MKYFLTQRQELIANKVAQIPGMKRLLNPVYTLYKNSLIRLRNRNYHRYAMEMMQQFDACMTKYNHPYALAFGSLLGAVREHGFIKHDMDIDITMWYDDYSEEMLKHLNEYGFRLRHTFEVEGGKLGKEDTLVYKDVSLDIYYLYPAIDKMPYCSGSWEKLDGSVNTVDSMRKFGRIQGKRIDMPVARETHRVPFENLQLPIPDNSEEILEFYYGKSWNIPNPAWEDEDSKVVRIPWETENITYQEWEG